MEGNDLNTHKIVTWGNAAGHGEVVPAIIGNQGVDRPGGSAQAILSDLEPLESGCSSSRRIVDLGEIDDDRT